MIVDVPAETADDQEIRAVVDRFFAAFVSGPEAAVRADDLRTVLLPEALLVSAAGAAPTSYDVDSFIAPRVTLLGGDTMTGFHEWVESARVDRFGDIAQVWCGYAKSWLQDGEPRQGSGAKSLQLVRTTDGWRISAVVWDDL